MTTCLIDVGGGMRDIYGSGVTDCFIDNNINFDYCIGVSAGSANICSYMAGQKGRNYRFYTDYASRREYMSLENYIKNGSYINLDYIYSELSNDGGEDPVDFEAFMNNPSKFYVVVTNAKSGEAEYIEKEQIGKNDLWLFKASSALPVVCKPYMKDGKEYFDGGISDPLPIEKALDLGCDKIVMIIPRPPQEKSMELSSFMKPFLKDYPAVLDLFSKRPETYNKKLSLIYELRDSGKLILLSPDTDKGLNMLTRDKNKLTEHYLRGYNDANTIINKI